MSVLELKAGDHIYSPRTGYDHHGIYIGDDKVIHYSGLSNGISKGGICETTLFDFSGDKQQVGVIAHSNAAYLPQDIVQRAIKKIGENDYNVVTNNCEHFTNWCVTGVKESKQVQSVVKSTVDIASISYKGYKIYQYVKNAQTGANLISAAMKTAGVNTLRVSAPTMINSTIASTATSSVVKSAMATTTASNLAGMVGGGTAGITSGFAVSGGTTAVLSAVTGVSAVGAAPVVVGIAVATGVGFGVKYLWGKIFD